MRHLQLYKYNKNPCKGTDNQESREAKMLKVKSSCMVKPANPTPNVHLWLPECDQVSAFHEHTIYFYDPIGDSSALVFETLKDSLSKALVPFFPLAGRLLWIDDERNRLQLHCNEMGAVLLEAESDAQMVDFGDFRPTPEISRLVPSIDYDTDITKQPVLLVQLTRFKCGGLSIGTSLSHVVADGLSAVLFFNSWAKIARNEKFDLMPHTDRTVFYKGNPIATPQLKHSQFDHPPLLVGQHDNKEERTKETTTAMIKLRKEQVEKLKIKANEGNFSNREYSRYEALAGYIWRCACKARKHHEEQLTKMRIVVDGRNRLQPPLPANYIGNGIVATMPISKSADMLSKPLSYAASLVREAVKMIDDKYIKSVMDFLSSQSDLTPFRTPFQSNGNFFGNPNLAVISWIGLPIYGADFGWGKPIHIGPAAIESDGKFFIIPGPDEDGSCTIVMHLQVAHMDDFKNFFYEDIKL